MEKRLLDRMESENVDIPTTFDVPEDQPVGDLPTPELPISSWLNTEEDDRARTRQLADWISKDPGLQSTVDKVAQEVLNDYKNQLGAYLVALARRRVHRIQRLMAAMELVEEQLILPSRINNASYSELVKLMNNYRQQINDAVSLINEVVHGQKVTLHLEDNSITNVLNAIKNDSGKDIDLDSTAVRTRIRQIFDNFKKEAVTIDSNIIDVENEPTK
jgi:hypothetical protein